MEIDPTLNIIPWMHLSVLNGLIQGFTLKQLLSGIVKSLL